MGGGRAAQGAGGGASGTVIDIVAVVGTGADSGGVLDVFRGAPTDALAFSRAPGTSAASTATTGHKNT